MGYNIQVVEKNHDGNEIIHNELHVTWNYNARYTEVTGQTLRDLIDGKKCSETTGVLSNIVSKLGTNRHSDGWEPTPGNAGATANDLMGMALSHPNAYWNVH